MLAGGGRGERAGVFVSLRSRRELCFDSVFKSVGNGTRPALEKMATLEIAGLQETNYGHIFDSKWAGWHEACR